MIRVSPMCLLRVIKYQSYNYYWLGVITENSPPLTFTSKLTNILAILART